jgi:hypothetical protein
VYQVWNNEAYVYFYDLIGDWIDTCRILYNTLDFDNVEPCYATHISLSIEIALDEEMLSGMYSAEMAIRQ